MDRADHRLHGDCHPHSSWYYLLHGNPLGVQSEEVLYRHRFYGGLSPYYILGCFGEVLCLTISHQLRIVIFYLMGLL